MIHIGDCLQVMPTLAASSADSIVTDPPYGLGFMGKAWDHGVPGAEFWLEALRVAKPGAFLAAFGGTRTFHRLACGIEDAGWELRDTLMWVYGSGFPKSHNGPWGGTALKPAWEPIILARKPLAGTVEANWREHGTGALNIEGCRIAGEPVRIENYASDGANGCMSHGHGGGSGHAGRPRVARIETSGRWPANLVHDGSDEVLVAFPDAPGQAAAVTGNEPTANGFSGNVYGYGGIAERARSEPRRDSGSAARFFYCAKADRADRNAGCKGMPLGMPAAPNGAENAVGAKRGSQSKPRENIHPTVKPTDLMRWLCRLVTPAGGLVLDPFAGSGSTGRGAIAEGFQFVGIELSPEYGAIAEARIRVTQPGLSLEAG